MRHVRDLDESLVQAVGCAVIEAGLVEGTAGELLMLFRPTGVTAAARDWHSSGSTLANALLRAAAERNNLQLRALADRMEHATKQRNDVVHGEWIHASGVALVTFRRSLPKAGPEGGYTSRQWTLESLQRLAEEYRALEKGFSDLVSEFMGIAGTNSKT